MYMFLNILINFILIQLCILYIYEIQSNCFSFNFCTILNKQKLSSRDRDWRFNDDFRKPLRSVVQKVSRDLHTEKTFSHGDSTLCDSVWGWTSTRMTGIKIDPTRVRNCFCACSCLPVRLRRETIEIASGSFEISLIFLQRISNADD